jgi:triacylglycerol lipase
MAEAAEATRPATLLVPGWSDTARELRHARDFLVAAGWPATHVQCIDFRDRYGSNVAHAEELAAAAAGLLEATGQKNVAVVAHSMGGLATRLYLDRVDAVPVHTAIFLATPHHGTWAAWLAWGGGAAEMRPGSAFLRDLAGRTVPAHIRVHCIRTAFDTRVIPGRSAFLEGSACHTVRTPAHPRMLRHGPTLHLVRELLSPPR